MSPGIDPASVLSVSRGVAWSPEEWKLISRQAADADMATSQWIRETVLARLERETGYTDTARRPAPRRRNYRRRGGTKAQQREAKD